MLDIRRCLFYDFLNAVFMLFTLLHHHTPIHQ